MEEAQVIQSPALKQPSRRSRCGRPTKYNPQTVRRISAAVSDGMPFIYAATMGGISHETFCQWQRKYPDFSESIQRALAKGIAARLKLIKNAAKEDAKLACWWLEHCLPEHFARNRIEHEHSGKIAHEMVVAPETLKAIAESRARYEKSHVDG